MITFANWKHEPVSQPHFVAIDWDKNGTFRFYGYPTKEDVDMAVNGAAKRNVPAYKPSLQEVIEAKRNGRDVYLWELSCNGISAHGNLNIIEG